MDRKNLNKFALCCFKQFLIENHLYISFINNYYICSANILSIISRLQDKSNLISKLLNWENTKEGFKYWMPLHYRWIIYWKNIIQNYENKK